MMCPLVLLVPAMQLLFMTQQGSSPILVAKTEVRLDADGWMGLNERGCASTETDGQSSLGFREAYSSRSNCISDSEQAVNDVDSSKNTEGPNNWRFSIGDLGEEDLSLSSSYQEKIRGAKHQQQQPTQNHSYFPLIDTIMSEDTIPSTTTALLFRNVASLKLERSDSSLFLTHRIHNNDDRYLGVGWNDLNVHTSSSLLRMLTLSTFVVFCYLKCKQLFKAAWNRKKNRFLWRFPVWRRPQKTGSSSSLSHAPLKADGKLVTSSSTTITTTAYIVESKIRETWQEGHDEHDILQLTDHDWSGEGILASEHDLVLSTEEFVAGCSLLQATARGDVAAIQDTIEKFPLHANFRDYDRRTPLHVAASEGHVHVCKMLVEHYKARVNRSDRWGGTPLDDAQRHQHKTVVHYLQGIGAMAGSTNRSAKLVVYPSTTATAATTKEGREEVKVPPNEEEQTNQRRTPMHLA